MSHQMQLTSLYCKWGAFGEEQFNSKFRQDIERRIIMFHMRHDGLTDEELLTLFGNPDTNLIRPRRSDLSVEKKYRSEIRPAILIDTGERRKNTYGRDCIVWSINSEVLLAYMKG